MSIADLDDGHPPVRTAGSPLRANIRPCGDGALLVETDDLRSALELHALLRTSPPAGLVDLVPAARTVLVRVHAGSDLRSLELGIRKLVGQDTPAVTSPTQRGHVEIPVTYDGEDLTDVATHVGCSVDEVIAAHTGQTWTVAFSGFAPGFGYLLGENDLLTVPRRPVPRTAVPAGAVALAGPYSGVYPRSSPGGWQIIGHTAVRTWDLDRSPPALFVPGATVRFVRVGNGD
jgi:KipI family sensor histidine kinase inhibitor